MKSKIVASFLFVLFLGAPARSEWQLVPAGWTATEPGYFGTLDDGRDTLAALQTYRETAERWQAAYSDLRTEFITSTNQIKSQMADLANQLNSERKARKTENERGWWKELLRAVVFGGIGYAVGR